MPVQILCWPPKESTPSRCSPCCSLARLPHSSTMALFWAVMKTATWVYSDTYRLFNWNPLLSDHSIKKCHFKKEKWKFLTPSFSACQLWLSHPIKGPHYGGKLDQYTSHDCFFFSFGWTDYTDMAAAYHQGKTKIGITSRSDVGLLQFKRTLETSWDIGSRMKTPYYPIWVTICNENFGVLFSSSRWGLSPKKRKKSFVKLQYNWIVYTLLFFI